MNDCYKIKTKKNKVMIESNFEGYLHQKYEEHTHKSSVCERPYTAN